MNSTYHRIAGLINHLHILHRIYIQREALSNGLFLGQLPILEYIIEHSQCTQAEVAESLQVSPPSIATSIKRMQKAGLLSKVRSEKDCRTNRITVTEKGLQTAERSRAAFDAVDAGMFAGFSAEECDVFQGFLNRQIANLDTGEFKNKTFFAMLDAAKAETELINKGESKHA